MGRPRKTQPKSSGKKSKKQDEAVIPKPHTRATVKNHQAPSMVEDDENSGKSIVDPDDLIFEEHEILTPKSSLVALQQRSQVRNDFNEWINGLQSGNDARTLFHSNVRIGANTHILPAKSIDHNTATNVLPDVEITTDNENLITPAIIELDDIEDEITFWKSAIVCYVLGANPPQHVMEGYVHRIWGKLGVDKVAMVGKGLFLIRFTTMENCQKVINGGTQFFDSKPVIIKPWSEEINYAKDPIKQVPVWIKLPGLEVKYWGEKSLFKIAGQVGQAIRVDQATKNRDKLMFAKILVEVTIGQHYPKCIQFVNEKGALMEQSVEYDWLPIECTHCRGIGHASHACSKNNPKQNKVTKVVSKPVKKVWQPKAVQRTQVIEEQVNEQVVTTLDAEGFMQATSFSRQQCQQLKPVNTRNRFQTLGFTDDNDGEHDSDTEVFGDGLLDQGLIAPRSNG